VNILLLSTESIVQIAFIQPLAQHLRRLGHQVVLGCSDDPGEAGQSFVQQLRDRGFDVIVIPMRRTVSLWADAKATVLLYRYLRAHSFELVHVHTAKAGIIGRVAAWFARVPIVVYTSHGFPFHPYLNSWRLWLYAFLERFAARLCDEITVVSDAVRNRGLAFGVAPPEKIRVIPNGIDTERFNPNNYREERDAIRREFGVKPNMIVIGAIARFVPDKGLDTLLRTVGLLVPRFPDIRCLLVGEGPLRGELQILAQSLGLDRHVVFAGWRMDTSPLLAAMDIYMLPTRREGFGLTFVEAMSMEVPVVASRIAPVDQIIVDAETGVLATCDDHADFAKAVEPLLNQPELRGQMGRAGRRRVIKLFDQSFMCEAYERLFRECAGR